MLVGELISRFDDEATAAEAVLDLDGGQPGHRGARLLGRESVILTGVGVHQQQLGAVRAGEGAGPAQRGGRGFTEVGADEDALQGLAGHRA